MSRVFGIMRVTWFLECRDEMEFFVDADSARSMVYTIDRIFKWALFDVLFIAFTVFKPVLRDQCETPRRAFLRVFPVD